MAEAVGCKFESSVNCASKAPVLTFQFLPNENIFLVTLFFVSSISFSQTIKPEGIISDSKALPIEMANVMAVNQATKRDGFLWNYK